MIVELENPEKAAALFAGWEETIIWSCAAYEVTDQIGPAGSRR